MVVMWGVLISASSLAKRLGATGLVALERLMGLLLTAIAVEMLISGIRNAVAAAAR
jgi:small neutral amino acid transporter SnatA (MarC family)